MLFYDSGINILCNTDLFFSLFIKVMFMMKLIYLPSKHVIKLRPLFRIMNLENK